MKLRDYLLPQPKSKIKAGLGNNSGKYKFFTSSPIQSKYIDEYTYENEALIFGTGGNASVHYCNERFSTSTDCIVMYAKDSSNLKIIYLYLKSSIYLLEAGFKGAGLKHIAKDYILDIEFNMPEISEQYKIVKTIDKIDSLIEMKKSQLNMMKEIIASRFIELFGDPLNGSGKWPIHTVGEVADSVDPQPSHRTPPEQENGVPYVSMKDCDYKTGTINFDKARKISSEVLAEHNNRYTLHDGDFIIGKIGTIGNPIFVPVRNDYTLSANVVLVQPQADKVSPYFLKLSFESGYVAQQFAEAKNSTSQAAFGIQKVRMIQVMNPNLEIQKEFEAFVKKTDKSKLEIQKSIEKLEILKKALMQKYFG